MIMERLLRRSRRQPGGPEFNLAVALMASIWLVFLAYGVIGLFSAGLSDGQILYGVCLIALFAATYFLGFGFSHLFSPRQVALWLLIQAVPVVLLVPLIGWMVFTVTTYFVAILVFALPWPRGIVLAGVFWLVAVSVVRAGTLLAGVPEDFWYLSGGTLLGPGFVAIMAWMTHREKRQNVLERRLAISEEREVVARDVHDLLGHSLTVISLKAEVAGRLLEADPDLARQEVEEIARLSRVALAEVRSTVTRLRVPDLAGEVEAAARALQTAGIAADLPDPQTAQLAAGTNTILFSWALREAVTNVVRHSRAARCRVRIEPGTLVVEDDGLGTSAPHGNGLTGLARRVDDAGGRLLLGPAEFSGAEGPGTRLVVSMDGSVPTAPTTGRTATDRTARDEENGA